MIPRTLVRTPFIVGSAVLLISGVPLTACGRLGALDKPGPLNGAGRATERQAEEQRRQAQDPQRRVFPDTRLVLPDVQIKAVSGNY